VSLSDCEHISDNDSIEKSNAVNPAVHILDGRMWSNSRLGLKLFLHLDDKECAVTIEPSTGNALSKRNSVWRCGMGLVSRGVKS